jgi:NTE family protein
VFLQSGGTRVAVHVGALAAIEDAGGRIAAWAGVSAGSLVAAVRASGYTQPEAYDLMLHTDYSRFLDRRPLGLITGFGLCAGAVFEYWLDDVLRGRRFRDLEVPLAVVATDASTGEAVVFSNGTTPEEKVATAVRCSISIPGVFAVRRVAGRAFVDGCLTRTGRRQLFADAGPPSVVVRMVSERNGSQSPGGRLNLARYIRSIAEIVCNSIDSHDVTSDWEYDLCINVGHSRGIDFQLGPSGKQALYELSYTQCRGLLREVLPGRKPDAYFEFNDRETAAEPALAGESGWAPMELLTAHA